MRNMRLSTLRYGAIPLSLLAVGAMVLALFALSPSLVQGASKGAAEAAPLPAVDAPGARWAPPDAPSPPISNQQSESDSPATNRECKEELAAGRAVRCARNSYAILTVRPDGRYHINWSEWADGRADIDRYSVQRLRFMYRYNPRLESDGTAVVISDYTAPDVNSCWPWAVERDGNGEAVRWAWSCNGISNAREDPSGEPTSIEQLEAYADSWTVAAWTGSLLAPGRKHDVPVRALKIPGSRTEAHADNPQSFLDRLTQQQVDDGTHDLLASDVEMHLLLITVHFDNGSMRRFYQLVDGGSFADR